VVAYDPAVQHPVISKGRHQLVVNHPWPVVRSRHLARRPARVVPMSAVGTSRTSRDVRRESAMGLSVSITARPRAPQMRAAAHS
jgi:hypothetical protein